MLADISLDADADASEVKHEQGDSEAERGKSLTWHLAALGETIRVFVKGEPDILEVGGVQAMTGSSTLHLKLSTSSPMRRRKSKRQRQRY